MKTIKQIKVDTWLPIFSGFYGTIWETDSDEEREIEYINEQRHEKGLQPVEWDDIEWDYEGYMREVCMSAVDYVGAELIRLGLIAKAKYQRVNSPREYNFANDSIGIQLTLTAKNIKAVAKYLKLNSPAFVKYLKDTYTSRDGFISSYSNTMEDWVDDVPATLAHKHKLGSVLQFILVTENGSDFETELYEDVTGNMSGLQAKNYEALCEPSGNAGVK